jgi:hypothetical protein
VTVRRKSGGFFGDLLAVSAKLPWPVGVGAAVVSFFAFHALAGMEVGTVVSTQEIGAVAAKKMFQMIGKIGQIVVPITCLAGAAVGYLKQRRRIDASGSVTDTGRSAEARVSGSPAVNSAEHAAGCPVCGSPMVRRQARRGANAGGHFYGCSRYPACKGIRAE